MRIRWRGLELPTQVVRDDAVSTNTYGRFLVEPFERGFGTTVGNSLRRILLSSLEGAAVLRVKIAGADHEFMSLPGVLEDVTDIILNVKSLVVKNTSDQPKTIRIDKHGAGEVRGRRMAIGKSRGRGLMFAATGPHRPDRRMSRRFWMVMRMRRGARVCGFVVISTVLSSSRRLHEQR